MTSTTTLYLDGYQYVNGNLEFFPVAGAYVKKTENIGATKRWYDYVFNYTDHLGNIRLSYTLDYNTNKLKTLEENHYYPFGLKHRKYNNLSSDIQFKPNISNRGLTPIVKGKTYKYKYNGKELQDELGLNWTSMDYRNYDNALGRFMSIDYLSEQYYSYTPYNFTGNNPIYFSDPSGMEWYQNNETGEYEYFDGTGERDGWNHVGSAVSYYDENTGNFVNGNTEYDEDGNEIGTTRDILDGDGNVLEQGYQVALSGVVAQGTKPGYVEQGWDYAADNVISPIMEGTQNIGYIFYGTGIIVREAIEQGTADGRELYIDESEYIMTFYKFKNGRLIKSNLNNQTDAELISNSVGVLMMPINVVGKPGAAVLTTGKGAVVDRALNTATKSAVIRGVKATIEANQ